MRQLLLALLLLCSISNVSSSIYTKNHTENLCAVRGSCKHAGTSRQPCVYNGPPLPVDDSNATEILRNYCPMFYEGTDDPNLCCDASQIYALQKNMALPSQLLSRCQACYKNFLELWCAFTCDPSQSLFVDVKAVTPYKEGQRELQSATILDAYWTDSYADGMYESCVGVQFPAANTAAMSLLCGKSVENCSPQDLFNFLGSKQNGQSPIQLNSFLVTDDDNTTVVPIGSHHIRSRQ